MSAPSAARTQSSPFGLLGRTLGHSWSPRIHTMLGSAPYDLIELEPAELEGFVREGGWRGLNVTIPYKHDVIALADELSPRVRSVGAANTLVRRPDGSLFAENTDVLGFSWQLERFFETHHRCTPAEGLAGREVLVLGSGGASKAVRSALGDIGAVAVTISRTGSETYEGLAERHAKAALIVNTTPVGMYPSCPASPLSRGQLERLTELRGILDVVYNPQRTGICLDAEELGIPCESGLAMLVAQALRSSELFQGTSLDASLIPAIEEELRLETTNIALIGMPGAGKTSTGRALARLVGRPFVDLDDAFEVAYGTTAAEQIMRCGEASFRELETRILASYGARSGMVMACGGGVVTRDENYRILHQNSAIIMLDRKLEQLSQAGRPLSQQRGIERLAAERMHLYRSWADLIVECTGSASGDATKIRSLLGL